MKNQVLSKLVDLIVDKHIEERETSRDCYNYICKDPQGLKDELTSTLLDFVENDAHVQLEKENKELKQLKGLNEINEKIISELEKSIQKYLPCYQAIKILKENPCLIDCLIECDEEEIEEVKKALEIVKKS